MFRFRVAPQQSAGEIVGVEGPQVLHLFPKPDKGDGQAELRVMM